MRFPLEKWLFHIRIFPQGDPVCGEQLAACHIEGFQPEGYGQDLGSRLKPEQIFADELGVGLAVQLLVGRIAVEQEIFGVQHQIPDGVIPDIQGQTVRKVRCIIFRSEDMQIVPLVQGAQLCVGNNRFLGGGAVRFFHDFQLLPPVP